MSNMMIHCGGKKVNIAELTAIPLPERTDTYRSTNEYKTYL